MDSSPTQRLDELQEKIDKARSDRNKSFDTKDFERPEPVQLRVKSRRCLGEERSKLLHLDWSADKQRIAVCTEKGEVECWNAYTGAKISQQPFKLQSHWALCCAFSANGEDIIAGGRDNKCSLFSLSSAANTSEHVVARHNSFVSSCIFAGSQQELLTASGDKMCGLWDVETGNLTRSFQGHTAEVMSLALTPALSPSVFLSASYDGSVRVWDVRTGRLLHSFSGFDSAVNTVSMAASGETFAIACQDCSVRLFDLRADAELARLDDKSILFPCNSLSFSSSNRLLFGASNDYTVSVWDTLRFERNCQLFGHENRVSCVRTCPDGSSIASASFDGNVRIWA